MTSILDLIICWSGSWNPRIYSLLLIYYKGCFKGYKWTARWKHTGRGLDGLHTQEGYPMELGCAILPIHRCVHQPRNSPNLTLFMTASSCRRDWLLTQFPAPLTSLENGDLGLKVPNFSSWLGHSGNHPPSRSPPRVSCLCFARTNDTLITQDIPRDLQYKLCSKHYCSGALYQKMRSR